MRLLLAALLVLAAGCTSPSPSDATDAIRVSEAAQDTQPSGSRALPDAKEYSGTWVLGNVLVGLSNGTSYGFTLASAANITVIVDIRGPAARDAGAYVAQSSGTGAPGPVLGSTGGPAQTHRELTVAVPPGRYEAGGGLRDGALADFTLTVSFAP